MITKYSNVQFDTSTVVSDLKRLINHVWKLIPMRENDENWEKQISYVLVELSGLQELFMSQIDFLETISKLEGLKERKDIDFYEYRAIIFSVISLIGDANERIV